MAAAPVSVAVPRGHQPHPRPRRRPEAAVAGAQSVLAARPAPARFLPSSPSGAPSRLVQAAHPHASSPSERRTTVAVARLRSAKGCAGAQLPSAGAAPPCPPPPPVGDVATGQPSVSSFRLLQCGRDSPRSADDDRQAALLPDPDVSPPRRRQIHLPLGLQRGSQPLRPSRRPTPFNMSQREPPSAPSPPAPASLSTSPHPPSMPTSDPPSRPISARLHLQSRSLPDRPGSRPDSLLEAVIIASGTYYKTLRVPHIYILVDHRTRANHPRRSETCQRLVPRLFSSPP